MLKQKTFKVACVAVSVVLLAALQWFFQPGVEAADHEGKPQLIGGWMYQGNASCTGSKCHSADKAVEMSGQLIGDESNIWAESDPHSHAYESLAAELSTKIAAKLKIEDATASSRCLDCHAVNAPEGQQGEGFVIDDAVGCESCHGPAETWLNPHAEVGWTAQQRKALGAKGLLEKFGLVDTTDVAVRARRCVVCHLQIDKDMIDAGHPPLDFELYAYNYYISKKDDAQFQPHWVDPAGKLIAARLWATGQVEALAAAKAQAAAWAANGDDTADADALVQLYQLGVDVAAEHFGAGSEKELSANKYTPANCAAAAVQLATHADKATSPLHRRVLAFGVTALGDAVFDGLADQEAPEAYWDAHFAALDSDAAGYAEALKTMTDLASEAVK